MDLFEQDPNSNVTSNDRGIGNAKIWRVKKIIMGISYRNLRGEKKFVGRLPRFADSPPPLLPSNLIYLNLPLCNVLFI